MTKAKELANVDANLKKKLGKKAEENKNLWSSKGNDRREQANAIFQYPARMVPVVQRSLVEIICSTQMDVRNLIDPFVGSGTIITTGMHNKLHCYGQDINPLAILLTRVKTGPFYIEALKKHKDNIITSAEQDKSSIINVSFEKIDKWFKKDVQIELSKLRRAIITLDSLWARRFMWITLAEVIRLAGNDRTSTFKLHARPKDEIKSRSVSPIVMFKKIAEQNIKDLTSFRDQLIEANLIINGKYTGHIQVKIKDTAKSVIKSSDKSKKFDLLITSPPYGDNRTTIPYGQNSYLPLQWIDMKDIDTSINIDILGSANEIDTRSLGGRRKRADLDTLIKELSKESETLSKTLKALKPISIEKATRVAYFFKDFSKSLKNIVNSLNKNAYLVWTIGNRRVGNMEIKNDAILREYLEKLDVKYVWEDRRVIHQKRMPKKNDNAKLMNKEKILIFRKNS